MAPDEPTKEAIIRRLLRERALLLGYIRSLGLDAHLAEDVFQNVCVVVIQKSDKAKSWDHFGGWVRTIARYEAFDAARKLHKAAQLFDEQTLDILDQHWQQYDEQREIQDRAVAVQRCIDRLTPYARKLLRLRYQEGLCGTDLAAVLQRKVDTVYMALSRAHKAVADCVVRGRTADGKISRES